MLNTHGALANTHDVWRAARTEPWLRSMPSPAALTGWDPRESASEGCKARGMDPAQSQALVYLRQQLARAPCTRQCR